MVIFAGLAEIISFLLFPRYALMDKPFQILLAETLSLSFVIVS